MSTKTPADFYFDPVSPFAFLMWKRLREDDFGLEIRPVPVLLGALLAYSDEVGQTFRYEVGHVFRREAGQGFRFDVGHLISLPRG